MSAERAFSARSSKLRRIFFCSSRGKEASERGFVIATPLIILLLPVTFATGVMFVIWAVGIPDFSSSLTIVAPQRVQLPQVLTKITPSTFSSFSVCEISLPMRRASLRAVRFPVVV